MKVLRLRLRNFRGVAEREVRFEPSGVTIVEGPNEAGKSSLLEALDLLLGELDSSTKQQVRSVKPVDLDVATEIEADLEIGGHLLTYSKRFFRDKATSLRIHEPRKEALTGREAHQRVRELLEGAVDLTLYEALRIPQGEGLGQAAFQGAGALARALDRSAGQEAAGGREETLFERVAEERGRYFTPTGQEGRDLRAAAEATAAARETLRTADEEHEALRRDIEKSESLARAIEERTREAREAEEAALRRESEWESLRKREAAKQGLELAARSASIEEQAARNAFQARAELRQRADGARDRLRKLERAAADEEPALRDAEARARETREAAERAEERARAAERLFRIRDDDLQRHDVALERERLAERRDRILEARRRRAEALDLLASVRVDEEWLRRARAAHMAHERLLARRDAEAARLRFEALAATSVEFDGTREELRPGAAVERPVPEGMSVLLPGLLRISIRGGAGGRGLAPEIERARAEFQALLEEGRVPDLAAAEARIAERREAERARGECDRRIEENLRDLTLEEIEVRIARTTAWIEEHRRGREAEPPPPAGYDEAKGLRARAKEEASRAQAERDDARAARDAAERRAQELLRAAQARGVERKLLEEQSRAAERDLLSARSRAADDALASQLREAEEKARAARETLEREKTELAALEPERARQRALNGRNAAAQAQQRLRDAEAERRDLAVRLELLGGRGLFDAREKARAEFLALEEAERSLRARAEAAALLFETMRAKREEAQRSYRAPLRRKIAELGRYVFGDGFEVELGDDLSIVSRTLGGRTVPFKDLSGGAREQLALLARVACALLVAPEEGAPLILDDALGFSDPDRLEGLGAMLAYAGRRAQVIILTCTPGRFRHVGEAQRIRF